jgi:translocator assembly and maintenance protein 41
MKITDLKHVLDSFQAPIRYAIAYGSGAFPQKGQSNASMVDFMFGVTHAHHWHSLNARQNPSHYSSLACLGSDAVVYVQERLGAQIYYNTNVDVNGTRIKYGVVSIHHLQRDLEEWDTLYLAGRLQKPVAVLRHDAKLSLACQKNLESAVKTSLLMLPERFTEEDLFLKIAGLSYSGDFRMIVGENPHKVFNIVYAQMVWILILTKKDAFKEKYDSVINDLPHVNRLADGSLEVGILISSLARFIKETSWIFNSITTF